MRAAVSVACGSVEPVTVSLDQSARDHVGCAYHCVRIKHGSGIDVWT